MKLNVYRGKEIIKTYESDVEFITLGVVEAVLKNLDIEKILSEFDLDALAKGKVNNITFGVKLAKVVIDNFDAIKLILKEVFDGITNEELDNTKPMEVVNVLKELLGFSMNSLFNVQGSEKN